MRNLVLLMIMICISNLTADIFQTELTLNFTSDEFIITSDEYTTIRVNHFDYIFKENPGEPALPYRMVKLAVPFEAEYQSVDYDLKSTSLLNGITVMPAQLLIPTLPDAEIPPFIQPDPEIYSSNNVFPETPVEFTTQEKIRNYQIFCFLVSPFLYKPAEQELELLEEITLTVSWTDTGTRATDRWDDGTFRAMLADLVINPDDLPEAYRSPVDPDDIQYLIITSSSLASYFQPLIDWKTNTGVPAGIITTEYIYSNFSGSNNQLKIKSCLEYYYLHKNTTWVLLGGDNTIVPDYDCYGNVNNGGTTDYYMPTDQFYACFDNAFDWNADGDGIYGEINDNIDMGPEIIISRAPIRTGSHITAFVNKTLYYEQTPPTSNFAEDMLISGLELWNTWSGRSDADWRCEKMWNDYIDPWWNGTHYRFYDTNTDFGGPGYDVTANNLTNQINRGYNHMFMATHGNQTLWSTETGSYFYSSHAAAVNNTYRQGLITTMACITNAFDGSSGFTSDPCLSEAFIRNPNGGCVAYHGSSRYGWGYSNISDNHGPSLQYADYLYYYLFRGEPANNSYKFGAVATQTKIHYIGASSSYGAMRWLQFTLNTIGDPELDLLTADPSAITMAEIPDISINNTDPVTVQTNSPGADVCLNNGVDVYLTGTCDTSGNFICYPSPASAEPILVTVTAHNKSYAQTTLSVNPYYPDIDVSLSSLSESMSSDDNLIRYLDISNTGENGSVLTYEIMITGSSPTRSIAGSSFTATETEYESGSEMTLHLSIYNASSDYEWISSATLSFPSNVSVISCSDFVGGSQGDMVWDTTTGNGVTVSWLDPNGGWGQIKGGETATATANISVNSAFSGTMTLNWTLQGDIYGSNPHDLSGSFSLSQANPTLNVVSPGGDESWFNGDSESIIWEYSGNLPLVDIKLSADNGSNWSDIISNTANDGTYTWTVDGTPSNNCLVKVCSADQTVSSVSGSVFSIYEPVNWLSAAPLSGTLNYNDTDSIELSFDTTDLPSGTYYADIIINNNANESMVIPVILTVDQNTPDQPQIEGQYILNNGEDFGISWQVVPGATSYIVYSSFDPYAVFPEEWNVEYTGNNLSWSEPFTEITKFYRVTAVNEE